MESISICLVVMLLCGELQKLNVSVINNDAISSLGIQLNFGIDDFTNS